MKVLVTGGAGYIGSTVCSCLEDNGHTPIILDSLVTGLEEFVLGRKFYKGDIADTDLLEKIFKENPDIHSTIHCAALVLVPESVSEPYKYYTENVSKSLILFKKLDELGCERIVFSSSASIYDTVPGFMVTEDAPLKPKSPYARTKYMMEMVLEDISKVGNFKALSLRYFNPIGADPKLRTGIKEKNPSHVLGKLVSVERGLEECFSITGVDWETRDGTGIKDYIHVWDLARAHLHAVEHFDKVFETKDRPGHETYSVINLGTGNGVTVRELVKAFEDTQGHEINKKETGPRPGDVAGAYANANEALRLIDWKAELSTAQGIKNALEWSKKFFS